MLKLSGGKIMDEEIKAIFWLPTEKEKELVSELCDKCIDILKPLKRVEQKAFALKQLCDSFYDVSGIKIEEVQIR